MKKVLLISLICLTFSIATLASTYRYCQALMDLDSLTLEATQKHFSNFSPLPLINELQATWIFEANRKKYEHGKKRVSLALTPSHIINNQELLDLIIGKYPDGFVLYNNDGTIKTHLNFDEFFELWRKSHHEDGGVVSVSWNTSNVKSIIRELLIQMAVRHVMEYKIDVDSRYPFINFLQPANSELSAQAGESVIERYFNNRNKSNHEFNELVKKRYQKINGQRDKRINQFRYTLEEIIEMSISKEHRQLIKFKSVYIPFKNKSLRGLVVKRFGNSPEAVDAFDYYREKRWRELGGASGFRPESQLSKKEIMQAIINYYENTAPFELRKPLTWEIIEHLGFDKDDIRSHFDYLERLNKVVLPHPSYKVIPALPNRFKAEKPITEMAISQKEQFIARVMEQYQSNDYNKNYPMSLFFILSPFSNPTDIQLSIEFPYKDKINFLFGSFSKFIDILNKEGQQVIFRKGEGAKTWLDELLIQAVQTHLHSTTKENINRLYIRAEVLKEIGSVLTLNEIKQIVRKRST